MSIRSFLDERTSEGNWNIGGVNLPETGLSEIFGGKTGSMGGTGTANDGYGSLYTEGAQNTNPVSSLSQTSVGASPGSFGDMYSEPSGGGTYSGGGKTSDNSGSGGSDSSYSKSDAADRLGISKDELEKRAEASGAGSTEEYVRLYAEDAANKLKTAVGKYDQSKETLEDQKGYLGKQKDTAMQEAENSYNDFENETNKQIERAGTSGDTETAQALSTAKDVVRANRNVLRSLGILASSAAGEILSQPMSEYSKQRSQIMTTVQERIRDLEDGMTSALKQYGTVKQKISDNYNQLVNQINRDIRFNEFDKQRAVEDATSALNLRIAEITMSVNQYASEVQINAQDIATKMQEIQGEEDIKGDTTGISAARISGDATTGSNAQIFGQNEDEKKKYGSYLSSMNSFA